MSHEIKKARLREASKVVAIDTRQPVDMECDCESPSDCSWTRSRKWAIAKKEGLGAVRD